MAEKKAPAKQQKTVPKKAVMPTTLPELEKELDAKHQDLLTAKRSHKAGELVNPRVITATRKEIARLKTAIRAVELKETK